MHAAPGFRRQNGPRQLPLVAFRRPAPTLQGAPAHCPAEACLPLRPVPAPRRAVPAIPGTVPFADAAQAWFWTVAALAARRGAGVGRGAGQGGRIPRPCDPDDVIRALDLLYRRGGIGPAHARVLRRWGERFAVPTFGGTTTDDATLWSEAMAQLDGVLRPKGILE